MRPKEKITFAALAAISFSLLPFTQGRARASVMVDVVEMTATQIEAGLTTGKFSDVDLIQSYLNRIDQYNPSYNAFTYINPDALAQAAAVDAQIKANGGVTTLPLEGVPVVIKDSMNVAGVRTTGGYTGFVSEQGGVDMIPVADAPVVARLKAAGAIILGKTNLPRFARTGASANTSAFGPTYNAYNKGIVPGGSSTGTATATSASFATMGMAEETGGSIENPAGAEMLVGVKTSFGMVPTSGGIPLNGSTRDVFGPIARTVTDAANMLSVIAGYDPSDPKTAASNGHIPTNGFAAGLSTASLQGKRIGLFSSAFKNVTLSPETQSLYNKDVAILQARGATVVSDPFSDPALASKFNTLASTFSSYSGSNEPYDFNQWMKTLDPSKSPTSTTAYKSATGTDLLAENGPLLGSYASTPGLADAVANPQTDQTPNLKPFFDGRAKMLGEFEQVMKDYNIDAFFFPQMFQELGALPAPPATGSYPNTTVSEVNLLGTPLVDLPGGTYADGTPFSVAFLGDTWTEANLLDYAYAFEQATLYRTAPNLTTAPEPAAIATLGVGAIGLLIGRRRRNHARSGCA